MAEISISTVHVVDGRERGDTPQAVVQRPNRLNARPADTVIAFFDLPGAPANSLGELANTLGEAYQKAPGGVATAIRLALKLANERLVQQNSGSAQPYTGSVSAAVISGAACVIAQAGPAMAYARAANGMFERIAPPARSTLFGSGGAEVYVANIAWQAGDAFVLSGSTAMSPGGRISDDLIDVCMSRGDGRMIAGYLNANIKTGFMSGVAFTIGAPIPHEGETGAAVRSDAVPLGESMAAPAVIKPRNPAPVAPAPVAKPMLAALPLRARIRAWRSALMNTLRGRVQSAASSTKTPIRVSPERERIQKIGLAALALALPIVVAAIVTGTSLQLRQANEQRTALATTRDKVAAASRNFATEPNSAAPSMQDALAEIRGYELRYPADKSLESDRTRLNLNIETLFKARRGVVVQLAAFENGNPRRLAAFDGGVFVLDTTANKLEQFVLNTDRATLRGRVPIGEGVALPSMRDVTWATPKERRWTRHDGAVAISTEGVVVFNSTDAKTSVLRIPEAAKVPNSVAIDLYGDRVFQLDTVNGNVWRLTPQGDTWVASPYLVQNAVNLKDGIDLAIDGGVFVLRNDPVMPVVRATQGQLRDFVLQNMPAPLQRPVALAVSKFDPEEGSLFIGDAGTGAINEFNKTGAFLKQHRAPNDVFVGMTDMSYDFTTDTFFVSAGGKLFSFKSN